MSDKHVAQLKRLIDPLRVEPGREVVLGRDFDPGYRAGLQKDEVENEPSLSIELLSDYQQRLAAQDAFAVLVVLQGIDAAGKDGTIRHVMSGVNPQGVVVHSFKEPSEEELSHDFLWRCARHLPARGQIGIFNRSHYEEVLVVRVHPEMLERELLPPTATGADLWKRRYREINEWERYLVDNGTKIVKLFLNLSREEQRIRFLERIDSPDKNWKFSASDVREREHWDEYQTAFSDMLSQTSTKWAPWYVVPADHKWFAHVAVGMTLVHALMDINPQYPTVDSETRQQLEQARAQLQAEAPKRDAK
jgi:PPK2 family polyphosphate:nucleotide phosphotransferase